MRKATLALLLFSIGLSGCAELNSIHRTERIPVAQKEGEIITVDAKQRHLLIMPEFDTEAHTRWRVCAEAAPDVFSAFAASGGAKGDKSGGEVSFASAETAASIERTQTINLLRESFYRTCERYASGAINRTQFIIQAARDQRSMVAVLSVEQLTGAVRPRSTIISGPGTAASTISGADAAALVDDYNKRLKTAEGAQESAKKAVDSAKKDGGVCADGEKKDEAACTALNLTWDQSKKDVTSATDALNNAIKLSEKLITATASSSNTGTNEAGRGVNLSQINESNLTAVAHAVVKINEISAINEPLMFCIGYLSDQTKAQITLNNPIIKTCLDLIVAKQNADQKFLGLPGFDPINVKIGEDAAVAALKNEQKLEIKQKIESLVCGNPKTDNIKFNKIIQKGNELFKDSSWISYIGTAKSVEELYKLLMNSTFEMQDSFIKAHNKICGDNL